MEIKTKFDIGNRVYPIIKINNTIREKCPVCNGTGKIEYKSKLYECPESNCNKGFIYKFAKKKYEVGHSIIIRKIDIIKTKHKTEVLYFENESGSGGYHEEEFLFGTLEEAMNKCKIINNIGETSGEN